MTINSKSRLARLSHQAPRSGRRALVAAFQAAAHERAAPRAPYTHLVRFVKLDTPAGMGPVPCSFRTTADAVEIHLAALFKQARAGSVTCVEAVLLSSPSL